MGVAVSDNFIHSLQNKSEENAFKLTFSFHFKFSIPPTNQKAKLTIPDKNSHFQT